MSIKNITFFFIFVIINFTLFCENTNLSLYFKAAPSFLVSKTGVFPAGLQSGGEYRAGVSAKITQNISASISIGTHLFKASTPLAGIIYRGYSSSNILLNAGTAFKAENGLNYGFNAGVMYSGAKYDLTDTYFFFPSIFLEPFVEITPQSKNKNITVRLAVVPVYIHIRKDLLFSVSSGYLLQISYYLF